MGVLCESGSLGLLRREEALLLLGEIKELARRFSVRLSHSTILHLFCGIGQSLCLRLSLEMKQRFQALVPKF